VVHWLCLTIVGAGVQVVVDRPDMVRCMFLTKRLAITDLHVDVPRLAKKKEIKAAFEGVPPA
jgi:hypothetical protein